MSSPFQQKFSSKSPLHGAYESAADNPVYISDRDMWDGLQKDILATGFAAKKRDNQLGEWGREADDLYPDFVEDNTKTAKQNAEALKVYETSEERHRKHGGGKGKSAEERCLSKKGRQWDSVNNTCSS